MKYILVAAITLLLAPALRGQVVLGYLSLDGIDDYAERDNGALGPLIPDSHDWTVELRFNMCADQGQQYLFDSRGSTAGNGIQVRFSNQSTLNVQTQGAPPGSATSHDYTVSTVLGKWHHFAITFRNSDSTYTVYFDGISVGTFVGAFTPRNNIFIGRADYTSAGFMDGRIDDFRVSSVIRYTGTFIPPTVLTPDFNALLLWNFDDGQGATSFDDISLNDWDLTGHAGAHVNNIEFTLPDPVVCEGQSAELGASGGTIFSWSPGASLDDSTVFNPIASPQSTTVYTVTVTDSNSCVYVAAVTVTVQPPPSVSATADEDTICEGLSTVLHGHGALTYTWNPITGLNNPNIPNPIATPPSGTIIYTVTGADALGCVGSGTIALEVLPAPNVDGSSDDDTICVGESTQLNANGALTYSWIPTTGLDDPNIPNPTASPITTTSYTVTGFDAKGCFHSDGVTIVVETCPGITDPFGDDLQISPNPASGGITIYLPVPEAIKSIQLFNPVGELVGAWKPSSEIAGFDVSNLPAGAYLVAIIGAEGKCLRRLIIE
jgi:hypothetical protein